MGAAILPSLRARLRICLPPPEGGAAPPELVPGSLGGALGLSPNHHPLDSLPEAPEHLCHPRQPDETPLSSPTVSFLPLEQQLSLGQV